jgi:hypothetical protein
VTEHQEESVVVPVAVRDLVSASPSDTRSEVHLSGSSGLLQHQQWRQQAASAATSSAAQPQKIPVNAVHLAGEIDFQSFATDVNPKHSAIARDHALLEVRVFGVCVCVFGVCLVCVWCVCVCLRGVCKRFVSHVWLSHASHATLTV